MSNNVLIFFFVSRHLFNIYGRMNDFFIIIGKEAVLCHL